MKTTSQNRTGNGNKNAQSALAELNAQIEALTKQRVTLAEPLKGRYGELRSELMALETEIRGLDGDWKPEPMKAKAETKITELLSSKGPMTPEEIVAAVGDAFTPWKVKNTLKKRSTGAKAVFTLADGKYAVKATA
jgi:hypothetical protein